MALDSPFEVEDTELTDDAGVVPDDMEIALDDVGADEEVTLELDCVTILDTPLELEEPGSTDDAVVLDDGAIALDDVGEFGEVELELD